MPSLGDYLTGKYLTEGKWGDFLLGKEGKFGTVSPLTNQQQELHSQYLQSLQRQGAGGSFGDISDYYRGLFGEDSRAFNDFAAPEMRRFREETIPGLAEQFAGMGSGALSSSGFQQAATGAGADLGERLAMLRQNLRQQGISGLQQFAQGGLTPVQEVTYQKPQSGLFSGLAGGLGQGLGTAAGVALGGPLGALAGGLGSQLMKGFGLTSPYGKEK